MRTILIRIEVDDTYFVEAWNVAHKAADGIGEDLLELERLAQRYSVKVEAP